MNRIVGEGFYKLAENNLVESKLLTLFRKGQEEGLRKEYCDLFCGLIIKMLDSAPHARPSEYEVWEKTKEILAILKHEPHCQGVCESPATSVPNQTDLESSCSDSEGDGEGCFSHFYFSHLS